MSPTRPDPLPAYPARLRARSAVPVRWYRRLPDLFAVRGEPPAGAEVAERLEGDGFAICRGEPPAAAPGLRAVYGLEPAGPPAVPTGRVLVRLREGERAADRAADFERLGFQIHAELPYAPQAAWLEARNGDAAAALAGLDALAALPGVLNVEPQMLVASARR